MMTPLYLPPYQVSMYEMEIYSYIRLTIYDRAVYTPVPEVVGYWVNVAIKGEKTNRGTMFRQSYTISKQIAPI